MKFLLSFVVLALFAFQANSSIIKPGHQLSVEELMVRGVWDDIVSSINDQLKKISDLITRYIKDPQASISDLKDQLLKIINDTVEQMKNIYKEQADKLIGDCKNVVDCFKKEADKLGINIKSCYDKSQTEILALPQGYLNNITQCGTNEYEAGMKLIKSATSLIDDTLAQFNHIPDEINECSKQSWWNIITCITGVAGECGSLAINIPQTISPKLNQFVNDIKVFVKGVPTRIQACAFEKTVDLGGAAGAVALKFYECVKDKFPDPKICLPKSRYY